MTAVIEQEAHEIQWDGKRVPPERWGKDHMSTLVYIESRNVDGDGQPIMDQMRTAKGRPRRGKSGRHGTSVPMGEAPTLLADGAKLHGHDDWDCVDDMVAVGLIDWQGTGTYPVLRLTPTGWRLASAARQHLATAAAAGKRTWAGFKPAEHLPVMLSHEQVEASHEGVVGGTWTKEELQETVALMRQLCRDFYWSCFRTEMGSRCHPFLEFNGIMSKYVDLCRNAAEQGFAFPAASVHSGVEFPMASHDVDYFAEKFSCIFGPFFAAHPELADRFADKLVEGKH